MVASIKLLNISLVLLCIVTTAFICTYLAISSSNTALNDTKASRDNSVSAAFTAGEDGVRKRTEEYLSLLMGSTEDYLGSFMKSHRLVSTSIGKELMDMPWGDVSQFGWHRLADYYTPFSLLQPDGSIEVGVIFKSRLAILDHEDYSTRSNPADAFHAKLVTINYGDNSSWGGPGRTFTATSSPSGLPIGVDLSNPLSDVNWNASSCSKTAVSTNGSTPDEPCVDDTPEMHDPTNHPAYIFGSTTVPQGTTMWSDPFISGRTMTLMCVTPISHSSGFSGVATSAFSLSTINSYLAAIEIGGPVDGIPSRGRVYITLRSSWVTASVANKGILLGASRGGTLHDDGLVTSFITAHESTDPIISAAASMAVNMSLDTMALSSSGNLTAMTLNTSHAPKGEEFYYRVGRLEDPHGLDWYIHMVIDRAYILGKIDQKMAETRADIRESEGHVDDDLQAARTVMYLCVAIVAVGLTALSTVLVFRIIAPLGTLEREMAAVAVMRLESVNTEKPLSALKEVRLMQKSFLQMIQNLAEYRNYMPASVLQNDSDSDSETPAQGSGNDSCGSAHTTTSQGRHTETTASMMGAPQVLLGSEVSTKKVTLMVCNIVDFLKVREEGRMQHMLTTYLSAGLHHLKASKGIPDSFSGDRLYASWNGVRACASHRFAAYHCAKDMCGDKGIGARLSIGIVSGEAKCGNMGCDGMKRFSYIGSLSSWVHVVERIGRSMECEVAVDAVVNEEVHNRAYTRMLQHVVFAKKSDLTLIVHEALGMREAAREDEWMYQLEERQARDPYKAYNRSYEYFMGGLVGEALNALGDFDDGSFVTKKYKARLRSAALEPGRCGPLGKDGVLMSW